MVFDAFEDFDMDIEQIKKLRVLLQSEDIENVRMGLELCETLIFEMSDMVDLFGLEGVSDPQQLSLGQEGYPHGRVLYGWILCKLLELKVPWVMSLKKLDLSGCRLMTIPDSVRKHVALEEIDLSFNALKMLPDLSGLTNLHRLSIFGNPLDVKSVLPVLDGLGFDKEQALLSCVDVAGGCFMMGALPSDDEARDNEKPRHEVKISRDMVVMRVPVTQWLYELVMGSNPSTFRGLNRPVEGVGWFDAVSCANALSDVFGLSSAYEINGDDVLCDWNSNGWRLPTEAEWEYLARGGEEHLYSGSDDMDSVAWCSENSGYETHPVGQKQSNGFGLYDMTGNVFEWCWDRHHYNENWKFQCFYSSDCVTDPRGTSIGLYRAFRGGTHNFDEWNSRVSHRGSFAPTRCGNDLGFRLIRVKS